MNGIFLSCVKSALVCGCFWLSLASPVWADENNDSDNDEASAQSVVTDAEVYLEETPITPGMIERSRYWLAGHLDNLSAGLDSFFVDRFFSEDILEDDVKGSRAKVSFYTRRELGDPVDYKFGLSVRLVFPNTNKRLNLLLESEDEDKREADPFESVENNNYSAALRFILNESEKWRADFDTGVRWALPPDPFSRLRARRFFSFYGWNNRATQTVYYYTTRGWGEKTSVQFNRSLSMHKVLRWNLASEYLLNNDYFSLNYDLGLYHELSPKAALGYVAGASGDTQTSPSFYNYFASVRYRRLIYKDWVFAEVAPSLVWENDNDYQTTPVIMFRIESVISH